MGLGLEKEVSRGGLTINPNKIKVVSLTDHRTPPICIYGQKMEGVDQFVCLVIMVSADGGTELDVARRVNSTRSALTPLAKVFSLNITWIKLELLCSNVLSMLLYVSST